MVSTRSTLRRMQGEGSQDPNPSGTTPMPQPSASRVGTRTRKGRPESGAQDRAGQSSEHPPGKSAGPSRTPVARKKKGPYTPLAPASHRKNQSISTAFDGLGIEETLGEPDAPSSASGSARRSLGKRPANRSVQDGSSVLSSPIAEETFPNSTDTYDNDSADAIITPRRKGRPYKVDLNDIAPRTPPQPVRPTKVLADAAHTEFMPETGSFMPKVIRSYDELMTPEAIAKRSMEREQKLLQTVSQRARQVGYTASIFEDSEGEDGDSDDELPQIELPMDLGDLIGEETPSVPVERGPVTLGPEGTHIILDHFALSCEGTWSTKKPQEYPKEWVEEHLHGLARRDTDIVDG